MSFKAKIKTKYNSILTAPGPGFGAGEAYGHTLDKRSFSETAEGTVSVKNGMVTIRGNAPGQNGIGISFSKDDPGIVTLQRSGMLPPGIPVMLVLEEGRRHICLNKTEMGNLEIITNCRRLENRITGNGRLRADYTVEVHGFRLEQTKLNVEINKIQEGLQNGS